MQHSIKFGKKKNWTGEISGWYNSPSIWQGTFESKEMWTVDAGLQKNIMKEKIYHLAGRARRKKRPKKKSRPFF